MRHYLIVPTLLALSLSNDASAQTTAADPWKKVPVTTACFPDDGFAEKLTAAKVQLDAEIVRQEKINADIKAKVNAMDMNEKAQRMQAFMMKNPQQAMKMMQAQQAGATAATEDVGSAAEASKRLEQELQREQANYGTAVDNAIKPVQAKQKQLIENKARLVGEAQLPEFTSAADHQQYLALVQQENAEHEKACAPFFGVNGKFPTWLSNYRTQVSDKMSATEDTKDSAMALEFAITETPGGGYQSTGSLRAVRNYLDVVSRVYRVQRSKAVPGVPLAKK